MRRTCSPGPDPLVFDCELDEPPEKVFRALTDPDLVEAWLAPECANENVEHTLVEAKPCSHVRYNWQSESEGRVVDSVVTFTIVATPNGGSRLTLTHGDFSVRQNESVMLRMAA